MNTEEEVNQTGANLRETDGSAMKKKAKTDKKGIKSKTKKTKNKKDEEGESFLEKEGKNDPTGEQFIINQRYVLVKMLGNGSFGEIHLAYDKNEKPEKLIDGNLRKYYAIKFEMANAKNPQLKHEYNILEVLNRPDPGEQAPIGIPKVYGFDKMEGKCNYMIMDFLGPTLSDLFQYMNKKFSYQTVFLIAIQMIQRIEYVHSKGFIHRDIKPENFLIGLNQNSNLLHIIDFGLSKRYKDRVTMQHIPYRENRHLVGTARYTSINAHLGIEQSRRDDLEAIGYVLAYFINGRLPWQSKHEKGKYPKIGEKKLVTPPEVLCKKLPLEFSYYFHYCKNLRFDDRPDYNLLKNMFLDLLIQHTPPTSEFTFDWFDEEDDDDPQERNIFIGEVRESKDPTPDGATIEHQIHEAMHKNNGINDSKRLDSPIKASATFSYKDIHDEKPNKVNPNKQEFNFNLGLSNRLPKREEEMKKYGVQELYKADNPEFKSSDEDSPGGSLDDDEETERRPDKSLDDEEFRKILASSQNKSNNNENDSKKSNKDKDQIALNINNDSNYQLFGKTSSNKSKGSARNEGEVIVLKNPTGSTSSRQKENNNNISNDFIVDLKNKGGTMSNRSKK